MGTVVSILVQLFLWDIITKCKDFRYWYLTVDCGARSAMQCRPERCDVVRFSAVWFGVVWCGVVRCGAEQTVQCSN